VNFYGRKTLRDVWVIGVTGYWQMVGEKLSPTSDLKFSRQYGIGLHGKMKEVSINH
jgi:hypothetical protein